MNVVHPLQEVIDSKLTQKAAAEKLGISPQYLCDMFNLRRGVGAKVALRVQHVFGVDAMSILIRQAAQDLAAELLKQPQKDAACRLKAWRKSKKSETK